MPRKITPAELDYAERLYASGQSFDQVAIATGRKSSDGIRKALHRRGVDLYGSRPAWNRLDAPDDLRTQYETGKSVLAMAEHYGVDRGVITRWLSDAHIPIQSASEAQTARLARMSSAERARLTENAHKTIREMVRPDEWQENIAMGRERVQYGGRTSPGTDRLCELLSGENVAHVREKAIGRYNVDIALTQYGVAVEVLGGNWHGSKGIHARRTPEILNRGWHIVFVWNVKRCQISPGALDYIIAFTEAARRYPSAGREYRVIRGDGKLLASGHADDDEFPLVPPSKSDLN